MDLLHFVLISLFGIVHERRISRIHGPNGHVPGTFVLLAFKFLKKTLRAEMFIQVEVKRRI